MKPTAVPAHLNVRLSEPDRVAMAAVAAAITTRHRSPPNLTDTIRAALRLAAEAVGSNTAGVAAS